MQYLKFSKGSKRFSSSLTRDVVIAFRTTAKLFPFRKEVPDEWIIIRNGTIKLGLFPDLISASLSGTTDLLFTYHDKLNIAVKTKEDAMVDIVINRQEMGC